MSFEKLWNEVAIPINGESVSPNLKPLVERVHQQIRQQPQDPGAIKSSLEQLLVFLTTPEGRTNSNIYATDLFVCLCNDWEDDLEHLSKSLREILRDIGGTMHDAVSHPEIAESFMSLPEQLLERVIRIDIV